MAKITGFVSFSKKTGCSRGKNTLGLDQKDLVNRTKESVIAFVEATGKWQYTGESQGKLMFESIN
ncbi:MAG: hypothetical protein GW941_01510 [Candidatus Pacebacteria bacterium]|nr:hypothetical protein [Candidatus Paceibacterota bacterium]